LLYGRVDKIKPFGRRIDPSLFEIRGEGVARPGQEQAADKEDDRNLDQRETACFFVYFHNVKV
jgi:hypothetical protein